MIRIRPNRSKSDPRRRRKREAGMSILEVVLSMGVLVIASLTVATSTTSSFQAVDRSDCTIHVENAVRETLESLRAVDFASLDALDGDLLYANDPEKNILIGIRVSLVSPNLKAIEVEVFKKVRTSANQVGRGDKVFQALTYRSQR
jgi:type II secretory pathway pseudopilin PulG